MGNGGMVGSAGSVGVGSGGSVGVGRTGRVGDGTGSGGVGVGATTGVPMGVAGIAVGALEATVLLGADGLAPSVGPFREGVVCPLGRPSGPGFDPPLLSRRASSIISLSSGGMVSGWESGE